MVVVQSAEETGTADHILLFLLRIAISEISYIRGLFQEKYFSENSVLSPDVKNEKLMTGDNDLVRLIDLVEKGVYDALQKNYLKTLLFCICKEKGPMIEEYAFSFSYLDSNAENISMVISRTGSKDGGTAFKLNASALTLDQMRRYECKMVRALVSLMQTVDLDTKTEQRMIVVKLLYHDITPEDYEPPYDENEAINIWNKNPLKMEMGNANSKYLVLALKVKAMDSCDDNNMKSGWNKMKLDNDFDSDGEFSCTQLYGKRFGYVLCTTKKKFKFILDSGATHHICNDEKIMRNLREVKQEDRLYVYSADGKEISAERMGSIDIKNFSLNPVGLIPSMKFNVVSIGQLANQGLMICCGNNQFSIYDIKEGKVVGEGYLDTKENEYVFRTMKWSPESDKLVTIPKNTHEETDEQQARKGWLVDTGCAQHLVPDLSLLTNISQDKRPFQTANGTIWSSHKGKFKAGKLILNDVLCCESVQDNLMSGPSLDKAGYRLTFFGKTCTLVHKDGLELRGVAIQDKSTNTYHLMPQEEEEVKFNRVSQGDRKEANQEEEEGKFNRVSQGDRKEAKRRRFQ